VLHVLNGDATAAALDVSAVPGDRLVWRDLAVEGPAASVGLPPPPARTAYLAAIFGIDADEYTRGVETQTRGLAGARGHDEVVLWFEQDLYCAVTLWALLDWLGRERTAATLSLVYPALDDRMKGLGALCGERLTALFEARRPVDEETLALGARAWAAYASPDPSAIVTLLTLPESSALPFVGEALRAHLGRFPSVLDGLNEIERAALAVLRDRPMGFGDLFRTVTSQPAIRRHGMGDRQLAALLRRLAPLVEIDGATVMTARIALTARGSEVADGKLDWLGLHPIDTWLGGVRLFDGGPLWRWDEGRDRLVATAGRAGGARDAYNS
jgi:hypothetical protein